MCRCRDRVLYREVTFLDDNLSTPVLLRKLSRNEIGFWFVNFAQIVTVYLCKTYMTAPLVILTVTDSTSAPWMTLETRQAKVERHIAEQKWRQSDLSVHRAIYAKQGILVSILISEAKKDYTCENIVDCDSSWELFHLSNQMMGTFRGSPALKHSLRVSS